MRFKRNKANKYFVVDLSYEDLIKAEVLARGLGRADAAKYRDAWITAAQEGLEPDEWEVEYERNFDITLGKRVYNRFNPGDHVRKLLYNPYRPLLRGWDFGYHRPAVVFAQVDPTPRLPRLYVLAELMGYDVEIFDFIPAVKKKTKQLFPQCTEFEDFCDPSGTRVSDTSSKSSIDVLIENGIDAAYRRSGIPEGILTIRDLMRDNQFFIDESCAILRAGFLGGYAYPPAKENQPEDERPRKDGYYEHLMDALRYLVVMTFSLFKTEAPPATKKPDPVLAGMGIDVFSRDRKGHWYLGD